MGAIDFKYSWYRQKCWWEVMCMRRFFSKAISPFRVVLSDVFGVRARGWGDKTPQGSADMSIGKWLRSRLTPVLLQPATRADKKKAEFGWITFFFVTLQHSPNSLAFTVIDWLIPRMNSSSYQSPWKTTRALLWSTGLGEMYTNIRLLLVVWNDNLKRHVQIRQRQVQSSVFCQQVNVMASVLKLGVQCASVSNSSHITLLSSHHVRIPEPWAWCLVLSPRVRKALV